MTTTHLSWAEWINGLIKNVQNDVIRQKRQHENIGEGESREGVHSDLWIVQIDSVQSKVCAVMEMHHTNELFMQ